MDFSMNLIRSAVIVLIGACLFFITTPMPNARAMTSLSDYSCGVTLNSGNTEYLPADISGCDDGAPAVTIADYTVLDLRGHKIACSDLDSDTLLPVGVMMVGDNTSIMNGTIDGCGVGVSFGDKYSSDVEGSHTVRDMTIKNSATDGAQMFSDDNQLTHVRILDSGDDGVEIAEGSTNNGISFSVISDSVGDGIYFIGNQNRTSYVKVTDSGSDGIEVDGDYDSIKHSAFENNIGSGLNQGGKYTSVMYSHFGGNAHGIYLTGSSESTTIESNTVSGNSQQGIELNSGSEGSLIKGNVSKNNTSTDIRDGSGDCKNNKFEDNFFGTSDPSCIE